MRGLNGLLAATLAELDPVIQSLSQLRGEERPQRGSESGAESSELRQMIARINSMLDQGDAEALDVVEKLAGMVKGTAMSRSVEAVHAALEEYNYDAASRELRKLEVV